MGNLFKKVATRARELKREDASLREGLCYMRALREINPDVATEISGTNADCDYKSTNLPNLKLKLMEISTD